MLVLGLPGQRALMDDLARRLGGEASELAVPRKRMDPMRCLMNADCQRAGSAEGLAAGVTGSLEVSFFDV